MPKRTRQIDRFKDAGREAGTDMSKEEFDRVIGGLAKPKPQEQKKPEVEDAF